MGRASRLLPIWRRNLTFRLLTALLLALAVHQPAHAAVGAPIDPALQQRMAANPGQLQPIIISMHDTLPVSGINLQLAQQALGLITLNGVARGVLPLIGG